MDLYLFEDADGRQAEYVDTNLDEAYAYAAEHRLRLLILRELDTTGAELLEDLTSTPTAEEEEAA